MYDSCYEGDDEEDLPGASRTFHRIISSSCVRRVDSYQTDHLHPESSLAPSCSFPPRTFPANSRHIDDSRHKQDDERCRQDRCSFETWRKVELSGLGDRTISLWRVTERILTSTLVMMLMPVLTVLAGKALARRFLRRGDQDVGQEWQPGRHRYSVLSGRLVNRYARISAVTWN